MVTGGLYSKQRVTQYSLTGEVTELPDLITGRDSHACSKFVSDGVTVSEGVRCRNQESVECVWCDLVHLPGDGGVNIVMLENDYSYF